MSYTVKDQLNSRLSGMAKAISTIARIEEAVAALGLLDADIYLNSGDGEWFDGKCIPGPYIRFQPHEVLMDPSGTLPDAARALLGKVGKWEKGFDAQNNLLRLTGTLLGVRIVLEDTPPSTCTVRAIEEEVEVPAREAYTEKQVRYVLEGDCDPLLEKATGA
jgi:hypothetical protein